MPESEEMKQEFLPEDMKQEYLPEGDTEPGEEQGGVKTQRTRGRRGKKQTLEQQMFPDWSLQSL